MTKSGRRYRRLREDGICTRCSSKPRAAGRFYCRTCQAERNEERETRRKVGICIQCNSDAASGHTSCQQCLDKQKARTNETRAQWREQGRCHDCGREAIAGRSRCAECRSKERNQAKWNYHLRRLDGICTACYRRPALPNRTRCAECNARNNAQIAARRAARKDAT